MYNPLFVAKEKGWVEEALKPEGVTVKWTGFLAGPPITESFAAGQQDIGYLGDTPSIIAKSVGLGIKIIATAGVAAKAQAILARRDADIKTLADLKGKKVGVTKGSTAHHLLILGLEKAGLRERDIRLIHLGAPDLVTAIANGDLDAVSTWEPYVGNIEGGDVGGRRIADGGDLNKQGANVIIADEGFAAANPEIIKLLLLASDRGQKYLAEHPVEAAALITNDAKVSPENIVRLLPIVDSRPAINDAIIAEVKLTEAFLRETGLIKNPVDVEAFFDSTYLKLADLQK
jgi:sulfonate transport system substrate-binding protein